MPQVFAAICVRSLSLIAGLEKVITPPIPIPELGSTANSYSTFAGILAGFSFTALVVYLQRQPDSKGADARDLGSQVATNLLYSTASLIISAFLYANVTSQASDFPRADGELLLYGGVLGLSVLVMLYSLTLMIYEVRNTRPAVRYAYWLTVIAGPAIIFRFLVDVAQSVWRSAAIMQGKSGTLSAMVTCFSWIGICLLLFLSSAITVFGMLHWYPRTRALVDWLAKRPTLPALIVFISATGAAIGSIFITGPMSFTPNRTWFTEPILIVEFVLLGGFALACGCVIGGRIPVIFPPWLARALDVPGLRWLLKFLRRRNVDQSRILIEVGAQDFANFLSWLAETRLQVTTCRDEAFHDVSAGDVLSSQAVRTISHELAELAEMLGLNDSPAHVGKHANAAQLLTIEAGTAEMSQFRIDFAELREDSSVFRIWYEQWRNADHPDPAGTFAAIRTMRELTSSIAHGLDTVVSLLAHLETCSAAAQPGDLSSTGEPVVTILDPFPDGRTD
jgi:hypothetical protein